MKKFLLLLGLLSTICLTACGSKDFNMTFEEAVDVANHSELQNILAQSNAFEQTFVIAGNYDSDGTKIDANISSTSKQNLNNKDSESSIGFGAKITTEGETIKADGALDLKAIDNTIYLNLSSLNLTGSENLGMIGMMVEGFKNQWFYIPMSGLSDVPNTFSILKDSKDLNDRTKEIIKNEGSTIYNGKFTQFNGYNARKFSLDNIKLNELIKEYYDNMNTNLDEEYIQETPEINIENFEGYLVIVGKNKVATVIENMKIQDKDANIIANGFGGENYEMNLYDGEELLITITAIKKNGKYEVSAKIANTISLDGTISPKLSKSSINLTFDAKITIESEEEGKANTVIPFKGSWKYNSISKFTTSIPENAQDLSKLLGDYFGGMIGGEDYDYEDYDYKDYDYSEELNEVNLDELENIIEQEDIQVEDVLTEETPTEEAILE